MGHVSLLETLLEIRVEQRGNMISKFSNVESSAVLMAYNLPLQPNKKPNVYASEVEVA